MTIVDPMVNQQIATLTSANCWPQTYGCGGYYSQQLCACMVPQPRQAQVEAVEGGYVIKGYFNGKQETKRVALSIEGLAGVLGEWSAQFKVK